MRIKRQIIVYENESIMDAADDFFNMIKSQHPHTENLIVIAVQEDFWPWSEKKSIPKVEHRFKDQYRKIIDIIVATF